MPGRPRCVGSVRSIRPTARAETPVEEEGPGPSRRGPRGPPARRRPGRRHPWGVRPAARQTRQRATVEWQRAGERHVVRGQPGRPEQDAHDAVVAGHVTDLAGVAVDEHGAHLLSATTLGDATDSSSRAGAGPGSAAVEAAHQRRRGDRSGAHCGNAVGHLSVARTRRRRRRPAGSARTSRRMTESAVDPGRGEQHAHAARLGRRASGWSSAGTVEDAGHLGAGPGGQRRPAR